MTARRWLVVVLVLHLLLGAEYAWATPLFETPDEGTHFAFVHRLATGGALPVQDPANPGLWQQEGSQPPLYYALAAVLVLGIDLRDFETLLVDYPLTKMGVPGTPHGVNRYRHPLAPQPLAGTALAVTLVRGLSLALSLITIGLTFALSQLLFPGRDLLALLSAALVAFNPMALFINASVNNDNLLMLLSTAALWVCVRLLTASVPSRAWLLAGLGLLLGLAALTKISGLVLWPVAAIAVAAGAVGGTSDRPRLARALAGLALVFGLALAISGWWYWRNYQLYGDWLGLQTMVAIAGPRAQPIGLLPLVAQEWRGFVYSFWGVFGVFTILPARWVHLVFDGLVLVALAGGVSLLRRRARPSFGVLLLALFCLLTLAGVIRWTLQTPASQGRLLFGAIAPLSIFLAGGLQAAGRALLRPRAGRAWVEGLALTISALLAAVAGIIPVAYIEPRYAPPPVVPEAALPDDLRPVRAVFGGSIELVGYTTPGAVVRPGEPLAVTLYWRALQAMTEDYYLALHLLGRHGQAVGKLDTWPGGGLAATSQWQPGTLMADTYYLTLSSDAELPTLVWLDLYFWHTDSLQPLPRTSSDGAALPSVNFVIGRAVPTDRFTPAPEQPLDAYFEHGIELVGYDVSVDGAMYLTLYWKLASDAPVPQDYTVFLHLASHRGGLLVEPADGPPLDGYWPTSAWVPGQYVADTRLVALPPDPPPGRYSLLVGLYDPGTGERLAAWRADGTPWRDHAVVLEDVVVK